MQGCVLCFIFKFSLEDRLNDVNFLLVELVYYYFFYYEGMVYVFDCGFNRRN